MQAHAHIGVQKTLSAGTQLYITQLLNSSEAAYLQLIPRLTTCFLLLLL